MIRRDALTLALAMIVMAGCTSDATTQPVIDSNDDPVDTTTPVDVGGLYANFSSTLEISTEGSTVVIRSDGVPDHGSPYFPTDDSRYEAYNGTNSRFALNPNRIAMQQFTFRIPLTPQAASFNEPTPLGAIGVAVNGVAIFNQYAGPARPLTFEIDSFDQYNGHPQQTGVYHYHVEPLALTKSLGEDALIGVLLDGFPVYGPLENGSYVTNEDLDELHGHVSATEHFSEGIYHYHITNQDPYINGAGFYGLAGTVRQ